MRIVTLKVRLNTDGHARPEQLATCLRDVLLDLRSRSVPSQPRRYGTLGVLAHDMETVEVADAQG